MGGLVFAAALGTLRQRIDSNVVNAIFYDCPFSGVNFEGLREAIDVEKEQRPVGVLPTPTEVLGPVFHDAGNAAIDTTPLLVVLKEPSSLDDLRAEIRALAGRGCSVCLCPIKDSSVFPPFELDNALFKPMESREGDFVLRMIQDAKDHMGMFGETTHAFHAARIRELHSAPP